jgi:hypothetical protein
MERIVGHGDDIQNLSCFLGTGPLYRCLFSGAVIRVSHASPHLWLLKSVMKLAFSGGLCGRKSNHSRSSVERAVLPTGLREGAGVDQPWKKDSWGVDSKWEWLQTALHTASPVSCISSAWWCFGRSPECPCVSYFSCHCLLGVGLVGELKSKQLDGKYLWVLVSGIWALVLERLSHSVPLGFGAWFCRRDVGRSGKWCQCNCADPASHWAAVSQLCSAAQFVLCLGLWVKIQVDLLDLASFGLTKCGALLVVRSLPVGPGWVLAW